MFHQHHCYHHIIIKKNTTTFTVITSINQQRHHGGGDSSPPVLSKFDFPLIRGEKLGEGVTFLSEISICSLWELPTYLNEPSILVKSLWDTRRKSLTQLPVVSYCCQIIVLSTHSLAPFSPPNQCWAKHVRRFFHQLYNIEQEGGVGGGWTTFLHGTLNLLIKLDSVPTILSRIVALWKVRMMTNEMTVLSEGSRIF